jgi:hypothetical protein
VNVAAGDVDGDGKADIITGTGFGGGPRVEVFDATTGQLVSNFFAFDPSFRGGVAVAATDVYGDGKAEILAAPGPGSTPLVRIFNGVTGAVIREFLVFDQHLTSGVTTGDGPAPTGSTVGFVGGDVTFDNNPTIVVPDPTNYSYFPFDPSSISPDPGDSYVPPDPSGDSTTPGDCGCSTDPGIVDTPPDPVAPWDPSSDGGNGG